MADEKYPITVTMTITYKAKTMGTVATIEGMITKLLQDQDEVSEPLTPKGEWKTKALSKEWPTGTKANDQAQGQYREDAKPLLS